MVATDMGEEMMMQEAPEESNEIANADEIAQDDSLEEGDIESAKSSSREVKDDGAFADIIRKLLDSQEKIKQLNKSADKISKNKKLTAEQKRVAYMAKFNEAVLSFVRLPNELDKMCKTAKQQLWKAKERALKQIY